MADDREMEGHLAVSDLNESMSEESAERSRHLAELKDECDQLRQKVTEAETKRDEYATKFAEVTQRLTTLATETFKLRNDLKLREETVSTLQLESKGHQERADEAEKLRNDAIKAMREARDITATEGERLKEEIKKVNQENEKVIEDIEKITKEGLKWQKEARRLDTMVTTLELKDKEWQQQVAQKSQEIAKLNTDLVEMTTTALAKDDELIAIKDQLRSAAEQYQQLENETSELVEHIKKMERENEKVTQQESFKLQEHLRKVNLENSDLKREREELQLRTKRLEDENKALQTSNKHKDEQLLQYGVKTMPLRTGTGKGSVKNERDGEKVKDDKEPPSESYPHMSRGEPSQFPPHIETNVFIDEGRRDRPPSRQERPRKSRYGKAQRTHNDDESSEEDEDQGAANTAVQLTKALNSMARKTPLMTFDGSRDTVSGWTRLVKETQRTYQLTDDQIMIEIASAVKGPAKTWFEGEKDIAAEDRIEYSITEWMDKFKDEYGDRDEEVLGLREAYARKFELGKESLDQYYQAMMRFKAKRIITEKQAVGFLIEGCRGDNELYKALRMQKCKTPTDVKDFFRHWATGEEKYKAPKGQRTQDYVTIRQGQVENVPQQRMAAAPAQQPVEYRVETPVREVTEKVTFIDN
ncbi:golgin subfamily A member 6-like protein 22 [Paramacrobiotus metropolitanus]|uniref:golgin subfamily A member 6-like protein 22 n=1 Tax=Paramacrobiotus metropolitanus TaxID=2943436 RepID=UPI002445C54D|nr:golgin subfamily A member 6-like protein 22 [Paramacrobiotus metropolitanus]